MALAANVNAADGAPELVRDFGSDSLKSVTVKTDAAGVKIKAGSVSEVHVETFRYDPKRCEAVMQLDGDNLILTIENRKRSFLAFLRKSCKAVLSVAMPPSLPIKVYTGSGDIHADGLAGEGDYRSGSGDLALTGLAGNLVLKTGTGSITGELGSGNVDASAGSGDIDLRGLTGDLKAETGSGDISLVWKSLPILGGGSTVRTGSGDITMTFPANARLDPHLSAGSGDVRNVFPQDLAGFKVKAFTGSGDIALKRK